MTKLWPPKTGNRLGIPGSLNIEPVYFPKATVKYDASQQKRILGLPKTQLS
jgi:hypothetical protein